MNNAKGFTMVEALAAVVLLAGGVTATVQCLGGMARSRSKAFTSEEMQRLAFRKYEEILATASLPSGRDQGDFPEDRRFVWRAERIPTGTGSLDLLRVEVSVRGEAQSSQVHGLICRPKEASR